MSQASTEPTILLPLPAIVGCGCCPRVITCADGYDIMVATVTAANPGCCVTIDTPDGTRWTRPSSLVAGWLDQLIGGGNSIQGIADGFSGNEHPNIWYESSSDCGEPENAISFSPWQGSAATALFCSQDGDCTRWTLRYDIDNGTGETPVIVHRFRWSGLLCHGAAQLIMEPDESAGDNNPCGNIVIDLA